MIYNPQPKETWSHIDGGSFYILARTDRMVRVQRRPFGDLEAEPYWIGLLRFSIQTTGRLKRVSIPKNRT